MGLLLDAESPGMEFSLAKFSEKIVRISEMDKNYAEQPFWTVDNAEEYDRVVYAAFKA
ncbi:hypothetical protein [Agathobaculum sp. Marseille-P7918]|uniref:hypothetical protein n=1 Tax=Agathobaculum sp. Marseille-P7918 TaxID=2479843 RepID=UPI0035693DFB